MDSTIAGSMTIRS